MMGRTGLLIFATCLCLLAVSNARELKFDNKQYPVYYRPLATILVEYSSAAYVSNLAELAWTCSRCDGYTKGFKIIGLAVDVQHCLQAFVGVAKDPNAIVIAFRGTQALSLQNWIEDLNSKQLDLNYPGLTDAMVHYGFYYAYHNTTIRPAILRAVERAKNFYGDIKIIVTGHSMGGAMASLCGLDLVVNQNAQNVQVMTFGQPRVGNAAFSSYYSKLMPNTIRVTNNHDAVPHMPPYYPYIPLQTYHHFPTEVWLYDVTLGILVHKVEKVCGQSGEDPTCSRSVSGDSILDHLAYYDVLMREDNPASCGMLVDPRVLAYSKRDSIGNFFLSRDPAASLKKLTTEFEIPGKQA